ncbi:MAG: amidohydrolase family protein [Victivallaceae bacterium]|nr:amidohydrolase family protein [Victivallaceae bacterium]
MIIDIHQHITYKDYPQFSELVAHGSFTAKELLKDMDKWGIDKSVVLPLTNPENIDYFGVVGNQEAITECQKHSDRLIPFCNIDPRSILHNPKADFSGLMKLFKELGCRGIGEVCANMSVTSPLYKNLFYHAGEANLPVLFHLSPKKGGLYGMIDDAGLNGLEEVLQEFPQTIFIGHAPSFWNAIDADVKTPKQRNSYPKGKIVNQGPLWRLMEKYPNMYGDFSAGSGHNALTRDQVTGIEFMKKFNEKIFFGTDMFMKKARPPMHLTMMQDALAAQQLSQSEYDNITHRNFERVFGK